MGDVFCPKCGEKNEEGSEYCLSCGSEIIIAQEENEVANGIESKTIMSKKKLIGTIAVSGAIFLLCTILICENVFGEKKNKVTLTDTNSEAASDINSEPSITEEMIQEAQTKQIESLESCNTNEDNHILGIPQAGMEWDETLFYWLEDTDLQSDENDNRIVKCNLSEYQFIDEIDGTIVVYEVYSDASTKQIYKIVTIKQLNDGMYELVDYYYDNGKPNFIFQRYDYVYTPTYATLKKPGNRYYFNNDVMVRMRTVDSDSLQVTQTGLTVQGRSQYIEYDYFAPDTDRASYDATGNKWLNIAYNVYNTVKNAQGIGTVQGSVVDNEGKAIQGVYVLIQNADTDEIMYKTTTDANGAFKIYVYLDDTRCRLYVSGTGDFQERYVDGIILNKSSAIYNFYNLIMHKSGVVTPVELTMVNANMVDTENKKIGAKVSADVVIREGSNKKEGYAVYEGKADSSGKINTELPSGSYTVEAKSDGFVTYYVNIEVKETKLTKTIYMVEKKESNKTAILLTWDENQNRDLDLTIFTPYQGEYGDMEYIGGKRARDEHGNGIEHDNAKGCEVAYIDSTNIGAYKIYVSDYTDIQRNNCNFNAFAILDVHIYILLTDGSVVELSAPTNEKGVVWEVTELTGNRITTLNRIYSDVSGKTWWSEDKTVKPLKANDLDEEDIETIKILANLASVTLYSRYCEECHQSLQKAPSKYYTVDDIVSSLKKDGPFCEAGIIMYIMNFDWLNELLFEDHLNMTFYDLYEGPLDSHSFSRVIPGLYDSVSRFSSELLGFDATNLYRHVSKDEIYDAVNWVGDIDMDWKMYVFCDELNEVVNLYMTGFSGAAFAYQEEITGYEEMDNGNIAVSLKMGDYMIDNQVNVRTKVILEPANNSYGYKLVGIECSDHALYAWD